MPQRMVAAAAMILVAVLLAGAGLVIRGTVFTPKTFSAAFTKATGIYPGDQVRVAGVKVGLIKSIQAEGDRVVLTFTVARDVPVPAQASAIIVAPNLISARYVQLTPAYVDSGPTLPDGAVIPLERTGIPVEWDEVKEQLNRLATELGAGDGVTGTSLSRLVDSTAAAFAGNGDKFRETLRQLAGTGRILAEGSGDLVETIKNLATFIGALRDSNTQIVQFQDRLATLTSVIDGSRSDLDAALADVSGIVEDVRRFVSGTRTGAGEQIQRLATVTQVLVDGQRNLEQLLHVSPTAIANTLNFFDPRDGGIVGTFAFANFANPLKFICGAIGAIENVTATESAKLCAQYLGPALNAMDFNYLPFGVNPFLAAVPPAQDYIYSDPELAPGGSGPPPGPPETPPAVSAYTGANNDVPPPAGYVPLPPGPSSLPELLLPGQPNDEGAGR
ncbi:MCE family protein [Mycobacterium sp. UM_Kg1]|uniref:MCE family protein n=1 Tax=Mycobacterium sp. UM_Kg1 TaxID=1545691 RepID=UPI00256FB04D|nr:MCE family protein [Mycobacterium sp. UM_Kg1]